jgi:hypothetical protein
LEAEARKIDREREEQDTSSCESLFFASDVTWCNSCSVLLLPQSSVVAPGVLDRIPLLILVRQSRPSVCPSSFFVVVVVFCCLVAVNKSSALSLCVCSGEKLNWCLTWFITASTNLFCSPLNGSDTPVKKYFATFFGFSLLFCDFFLEVTTPERNSLVAKERKEEEVEKEQISRQVPRPKWAVTGQFERERGV